MNLNELVDEHKELIYSIIKRFKVKEVEDLFQVGCIGLINAYNNYNECYQTKFTTYAYPYIVGEIYKYINNNHNIKLSPDIIKLKQSITRGIDFLTQKLSRIPTDEEICAFLEIDMLKLEEIRNIIYIDSLDYNYEHSSLYDIIDFNNFDKETLIDLKNAFRKLSIDERKLIYKTFYCNKTQASLAKELNTNQVKVSRELKKTLGKMRQYLE